MTDISVMKIATVVRWLETPQHLPPYDERVLVSITTKERGVVPQSVVCVAQRISTTGAGENYQAEGFVMSQYHVVAWTPLPQVAGQ